MSPREKVGNGERAKLFVCDLTHRERGARGWLFHAPSLSLAIEWGVVACQTTARRIDGHLTQIRSIVVKYYIVAPNESAASRDDGALDTFISLDLYLLHHRGRKKGSTCVEKSSSYVQNALC